MSGEDEVRETLDRALDRAVEEGLAGQPVRVEGPGWTAQIDARQVDRIGVVVDRLRVSGGEGDLAGRAGAIAETLRPQGERLRPVEVDPVLGGAVLRSRPEDMQRGRYYQVDLDATGAELSRHRRREGGRDQEPFAVTREELGRIVEGLGEAMAPKPTVE